MIFQCSLAQLQLTYCWGQVLLVSSKLGYILTGKYPDPTEKTGGDEISYCLVVNENNLYSIRIVYLSDLMH